MKIHSKFLTVIGIAAVVSIGACSQPDDTPQNEAELQATLDRIRPVGRVNVAGDETPDSPATTADTAPADTPTAMIDDVPPSTSEPADDEASSKLGEETYASACVACHIAGVAGAPKTGDVEAWAPRIAQGMDVLNENAIQGFQGSTGIMPAKGGRIDLSDESIIAAVTYMVAESGGR